MSALKFNRAPQQEKHERAKSLANPDKEFGEGNYKATRVYNEATRRYVQSGKVSAAAKAARPANENEAKELQRAEKAGRSRAKEEDPALARKNRKHAAS